ncbi:MAG: EF hand domain/PKD domain-containing protein [Parcubacteria group bacterium Gr01-1014_20]|nr:MAG: EF hand domain/PKD domain-containing protein [Parcubacteria group bacterium Gr01-1014_20]
MKRILLVFFSLALILLPQGSRAETIEGETVVIEPAVAVEATDPEIPASLENEPTSTSSEEGAGENSNEEGLEIMVSGLLIESSLTPESGLLPSHCGDIDQNNVVDGNDLELAQNYIFEGGEAIPGSNYDLNGDGAPNIVDIVILVNYVNRGQLPEECTENDEHSDQSPIFGDFNPPTSTLATEYYSYDVEATDPENQPLVFSLTASPVGMTISSSTGLIEWTPTVFDATSTPYTVTISVTDGENEVSEIFSLLVSLPTNAFKCGDLNGDGLINQLDLDLITLIAFENGLPHPLAKPDLNGDGVVDVIDVVTMVNHVNRGASAPTCGENQLPIFEAFNPPTTATATEAYNYDVNANDPDGSPITFSLPSYPVGMTISSSTGLIEWTPTEDQATSTPYTVTVQISDGTSTSSQTYTILVSPKPAPPVVTPPSGGGGTTVILTGGGGGGGTSGGGINLPPQFINFNPPTQVVSGQMHLYDTEAIDPENDPIVYSLKSAPPGMLIGNQNGIILWIPSESDAGREFEITVEAKDNQNSSSVSYKLSVSNPIVPLAPSSIPNEEIETTTPPSIPHEETPKVETPISNETSTAVGSIETGDGTPFGNLLAGLFAQFTGWQLGLLAFLILLLLLWIFFLFFWKHRKEEETKNPGVSGAVTSTTGEAILLSGEGTHTDNPNSA